MRLSDRSTFLLQSVLAVAALLVLAIGLRTFALREGGDLNLLAYFLGNVEMPRLNMPTSVTTSASPIPVNLLRIMVWVVLPITVIYAIVSPEYRRMVIRTALLIAGFLFVVNRLRANSAGEKEPELAGSGAGAPGAEQVLPAPPDFVTSTPQWFVYAIDVLIVLVVLLAAWFIWRRLRPRRQALPHEFAATAEDALTALDEGSALHDVILRCYADMTALLAREGRAHRHRAMTPRDFQAHLADLGMRDEPIRRLTRLFEQVRYGGTDATSVDEQEARFCLQAIVAAYGARA